MQKEKGNVILEQCKGGNTNEKIVNIMCSMFIVTTSRSCKCFYSSSYVHWDSSRSTDNGIEAKDGWSGAGNNGFQIAWNISETGGVYTYNYTISGVGGINLSKQLSHWILEVTDGSEANEFWDVYPTFNTDESPKTWLPNQGNSTPEMPGNLFGIKWDVPEGQGDTYSVTFKSYKDPVWGDFYAKDGFQDPEWAVAWNKGFGKDPTTTNFTNWIATPDNGTPIPIPGTVLLLGSGLMGLVGFRRKK